MDDSELWPELRKAQKMMVYFRDAPEPDLGTSDIFVDRVDRLYEEIKKRGLERSEPFDYRGLY